MAPTILALMVSDNRGLMKLIGVALLCVVLLEWRGYAQTNAPIPTLAEIKTDFDAGKYQDVLKKSQRAVSGKGDPSKQPDRAAIENLKGEAQLHLKQFPQAIESFNAAAKDATDTKDVGQYRAMALLVKRSPGGRYVPKPVPGAGERPQPIDIIVPDSRKQAFAALYTDESKLVQGRVDSVKQKQALKPMMDLTRDLLDLRAVEIAGTGSPARTGKMLGEISDQAARLMGDGLNRMSTAVDKIAKTANESYDSTVPGNGYGQPQTVVSKRGLTSTDKSTLTEVIANCKDIEMAAEQLGEGGDEKGSAATKPAENSSAISKVQQQATALKNRADQLLSGDYSDRTAGGNPGTVTGQQQQRPQQPPPQQPPPQQPPPPKN